jgi:hypothetical protein
LTDTDQPEFLVYGELINDVTGKVGPVRISVASACRSRRLDLVAASPIARRIREAPQAGRGLRKFHRNLAWAGQFIVYGHNAALLLFTAVRILQQKSLFSRNQGPQGNQRTMGADNERFCILAKGRTFACGSVNDNRNVQLNPLAAPVP